MAKDTAKLIDKRDHLRDVYDTRSTPANKAKLKAADAEVKKAMAERKKEQAKKTQKANKKPATATKKVTGKK